MRSILCRKSAALFIGLSVLAFPLTSEAQFLDKLTKGLEKVNKSLKKVDSLTSPKDKQKEKQSNTSQTAQASQSKPRSLDYPVVSQGFKHPFVTEETFYMTVPNLYDDTVSDVYEGVFTVKQGYLYSFWTIDGDCLYGSEWKTKYTSDPPRFDSGVAVAIHNEKKVNGKEVYSLLYLDGSVKQLDPNWTSVSQFYDGVALVEQTVNYDKTYFFINPRGEKIFPTLDVAEAVVNPVRPLRDGLRAVYFQGVKPKFDQLWGFVDSKGKIVIPAKYKDVSDFHGGYCWVSEQGRIGKILIDKSGNEVFHTTESGVGPVGDGIFYVAKSDGTYYYDVTGKELSRQEDGNTFFGGHAFIGRRHMVSMVDREFNVLKTYSNKVLNGSTTSEHCPCFGPLGLATYRNMSGNFVINSDGYVILTDWDKEYGKYCISGFGQFQKSGYAKLREVKIDHKDYKGLMDTDGKIAWLFGTGVTPDMSKLPVEPEPVDTIRAGIRDPQPVDPRKPPIGPKTWTSHLYKLTLSQEGEGTVSLSQSSAIKYGDYVTLTATPAEHWAIADITTSPSSVSVTPGQPFAVTSDVAIKVKFVKEEEIDPVQTGIYQGMMHIQASKPGGLSDDIPVYAELSNEQGVETPYGKNTSGFLVVMFDPRKRYVTNDIETYIFSAPLKVVGSQTDASGREWLVAEGGNMTFGNLKANPSDPLMAMYINLAMAFDGHSSPTCIPRRYRIEILDRDKDKDEFTFGELQTYSAKSGGWVDAQSKEVHKKTKGMIVSTTDKGMPADYVQGVRMKPAQKRTDVSWYPPQLWYDNNESTLQGIIKQMGNSYRTYKSDYEVLFGK